MADFVIGSMYALPLSIGAIGVGVLDLYCEAGKPLGASQFADAVAIAELITAILLKADSGGTLPASLGPWWNQPPSAREVHQATGMVMAQLGTDARAAYVRLQAFAFAHNRLITDVASDVVHRRSGPLPAFLPNRYAGGRRGSPCRPAALAGIRHTSS